MMNLFLILIYFSTISLINSVGIVNRRRTFYLSFGYAQNSSSIIFVNNQFPGPLIEVELNDIVVVHVTNNLRASERLTVHFHGMLVQQTPQMDGVAYITQMPIESQHTFTYVFRAYPAGTYFYHSHAGLQLVTAFGGFIVHDSDRSWNASEISSGPLFFSDLWFSPDRLTQEHGLLATPFVWQGEPTYLLINGKRDFVLNVDPFKQYLLRLIGATTLSTVVFGIDEHPMTVVEIDGALIKPKIVNSIEVSSGQRYAVIIETKAQTNRVYLMELSIRWRTLVNGSNCTGILKYSTISEIPTNLSALPSPTLATKQELRLFSFNEPYQPLLDIDQMPQRQADKEIYLNTYQAHVPDNTSMRWLTNNAYLDDQRLINLTRPLLFDLYNGIIDKLPNDIIYTINQNQLIDIIIQNNVATNGVCESHPFHLHGHKFWIYSQGIGQYIPSENSTSDSDNPTYRDTLIVYASSYDNLTPNRSVQNYLKPCGWAKIRILANNPGLWLLHCHIGSHFLMGMTVLLKEDIEHLSMNYLSQN